MALQSAQYSIICMCVLGGVPYGKPTSRGTITFERGETYVWTLDFRKGVIAIVSDLLDWTLSRSLTGGQRRDAHARAPDLGLSRVNWEFWTARAQPDPYRLEMEYSLLIPLCM